MKIKFAFYILILSAYCVSCRVVAPLVQHTPTLVNMASHTKANELLGSILYSTGKDFRNGIFTNNNNDSTYSQTVKGIQLQSSFSLKNNIAIFANYMNSAEENKTSYIIPPNNKYTYKRNKLEIGVSFFNNMKDNKKFFSSLGVGIGLGKNNVNEFINTTTTPQNFYKHNILSAHLQPSLYWILLNLHIAIGMRLSYINFNNLITNYTDIEKNKRKLFEGNCSNNFTIDYAAKLEYFLSQFPNVGLQYKLMITSDISRNFFSNYNGVNMGVGLCFKIDGKSKK